MVKHEKNKNTNYYKYATFTLVGILVFVAMFFVFDTYRTNLLNQGYNIGQNNAILGIIGSINEKGYVTFTDTASNASITLVQAQELQYAKEKTILEIMNYIQTQGSVNLYNNDTQMVLVEYTEPIQN